MKLRGLFGAALATLPLLALQGASPALACPSGQSRGALAGAIRTSEAPSARLGKLRKGRLGHSRQGVGDVLITVKCPLCAVAGQVILKKEDRALISTIVGRGVILSSVGVPTVLVVADGVTGAAQAITLRGRGQEQPMQQPALPSRAAKSFVADTPAACIVDAADDGAKVTAGWVSAPGFVDEASRDSVEFARSISGRETS